MLTRRENEQFHAAIRATMGCLHGDDDAPHVRESHVHKLIDVFTGDPNPSTITCTMTSCVYNTAKSCTRKSLAFAGSEDGTIQCVPYTPRE